LSRNNELLASAEPDQFPEHRQQFFFLNEQIRGIKEKITFLKGRERLLSGAAQKEEDQVLASSHQSRLHIMTDALVGFDRDEVHSRRP